MLPELVIILLFALGIVLIVKGGDFFVDAASWIAEVSGIPKLIIGATIVSVATTLPELLVSVMAAIGGKTEMAVGNAVGSVTANIALIMAIALIFMAGPIKRKDYLVKSMLMIGAAAIIAICAFFGEVNIIFSIILLVIFIVFIIENVISAKRGDSDEMLDGSKEAVKKDGKTILINILKFVLGAAGIVWGADLLVDNGSEIARWIGVSERIIGVTIVAVGTSLPELVTTITAIAKKQSSLSAGNIIGANIIDLTLIMPLCGIVSGASLVIASTAILDLVACLVVGVVAVVPALIMKKFAKWQGFLLLALYVVYVTLTITLF